MRVARPRHSRQPSTRARARARFCTNDVIEIWLALSRRWERGREYRWGKGEGGGCEGAEEGSRAGPARRDVRVCLLRGPTARGESQGKGERFCFLVTFIWALGDVGVRTLHKSGMAVCWCRHRDINPGARRLPSGYLFLLLLRRLFFVSPVYFSNLLLSVSLLFWYLPRALVSLSFSLCFLHLLLLRVLSSRVLTAGFSGTVWCTLFCI